MEADDDGDVGERVKNTELQKSNCQVFETRTVTFFTRTARNEKTLS